MILPHEMSREFHKLYEQRKAEGEGLIGAKAWALGVMLTDRRRELSAVLTVFPLYTEATVSDLTTIARLSAELTLIMIERGA